jgi:hypothetical protein
MFGARNRTSLKFFVMNAVKQKIDMKVKDFIKMLQEADPTGEMHIRMPEGIPFAAEPKPGYWDGAYSYIDEGGNWVHTADDGKVDIHCMDIYEFVYQIFGSRSYNLPSWEEVSSKFVFNLELKNESQRIESQQRILQEAKEAFNELTETRMKWKSDGIERARTQAKMGWTWFQNKLVDDPSIVPNIHVYYTWEIFDGNGIKETSNVHNVEAILYSGLFEKIDDNVMPGYYQWKIK